MSQKTGTLRPFQAHALEFAALDVLEAIVLRQRLVDEGVLAGAGVSGWPLRLVGAAVLGSYTTFSAWLFETEVLVEQGDRQRAVLNIVASVLLGLGAVAVGWEVGGLV